MLVTQTTHDLVEGSGLAFDDRGLHELKGIETRAPALRRPLSAHAAGVRCRQVRCMRRANVVLRRATSVSASERAGLDVTYSVPKSRPLETKTHAVSKRPKSVVSRATTS